MNKITRMVSLALCAALSTSLIAGCGQKKQGENQNIEIRVGYWPNEETSPQKYEVYKGYIQTMNEKRPDVTVIPDEFNYSDDTFMPVAASGQLPNIYRVPFIESKNIIKAGFARDITDIMKKRGYDKAINKDLLKLVTDEDGKMYGVPYNGYMMGMWYNVNLFEKAGLVNEDGSIQYPTTYQEVIETAKTIKEKTGQPGFAYQTMGAEAGWIFMNVAWSYGVSFMEQDSNGKWKATFNTPACVEALKYMRDLKWEHDVLPSNVLLDRGELMKMFATDQLAMSICAEDWISAPIISYKMSKDSIATSPIVSGPSGRYSQTGGDIWLFSKDTTDEQIEALFDWLEIVGDSPILTQESKKSITDKLQADVAQDLIVKLPSFRVWTDKQRVEEENKLYEAYININPKLHVNMMSEDVNLKEEEPQATQHLYNTLSSVIQACLTDKNANLQQLLDDAAANFQKDFLDKIK